jgi:regulatory protein
MKITAVTPQQKDKNRVNVMVDGKYRFSLDVFQYADLGIKIGRDYTEEELVSLETESSFGKVYGRALEYCLMRLHSAKEVRDYLYRKTRDSRTKTGEVKKGISPEITTRVFDRLVEKGYIDDEKFARYWVENRNTTKGMSQRKLTAELQSKGVERGTIERAVHDSSRDDMDELRKVIAKKQARYPDEQKFLQYLIRQGFTFDDVRRMLDEIKNYSDE